jgi:hypothetical protein
LSPVFSKKSKKRFFSMEKPYLPMFPRDNHLKILLLYTFHSRGNHHSMVKQGAICKAKKHPIKNRDAFADLFQRPKRLPKSLRL